MHARCPYVRRNWKRKKKKEREREEKIKVNEESEVCECSRLNCKLASSVPL